MPVFYNETDEKTEASKVRIHHWKPLLGLTFFYFFIACGIERIYQPMVNFFMCVKFLTISLDFEAGALKGRYIADPAFFSESPTFYLVVKVECPISNYKISFLRPILMVSVDHLN